MSRTTGKYTQLSRRAFVFSVAKLLGISVLIGRLYYLQFVRTDEYKTRAKENSIKLQPIPPERGSVQDCNFLPMASNQKNYRLFVETAPKAKMRETLERIGGIITLSESSIDSLLSGIKRTRFSPPILVREYLSWEELARIEVHKPELPGVFIDIGQVRHYPFIEKAAHLIGYVGVVAEDELTDQPLLRLPGFKIGKSGAEKLLEDELRGKAGVKHVEVNVHNLPVREVATQPSVPGKNVRLTVDSRLQQFTAERLGEESGAIVVMEIHSGNVLALTSMPAFDPNRFSMGITTDYWKELNGNIRNPLMNKAIAGQYPPGSTFKMLVGLAGLEEGVIDGGTRYYCPGHFFFGNHRFNCWKKEGHGSVNLEQAIAQSCDTFFYNVAQRIGIDPIASMARKFGLGQILSLGIQGEKAGVVPDAKWKKKTYNQPWQGGDTINVGIGQGYILATPLQLAVMTSRLANGGKEVMPRLVLPDNEKPPKVPDIDVAPEHLKLVQQGMFAVTGAASGTAYAKRIMDERFAMAGKTGTSQVRKILVRGQKQENLPWEYRHHAWFVGYAPAHAPKYAAAVIIEHGGGGASAAAPVARDVLEKVQQLYAERDGVPPAPMETEQRDG